MYIDSVTTEGDLLVVYDVYGKVHILNDMSGVGTGGTPVSDRDYHWYWGFHETQWTDTVNFHDLYDTSSTTQLAVTTVDEFVVDQVNVAQTGNHVSLLSITVDGVKHVVLPVGDEATLQYLTDPITVASGSHLEVQIRPSNKNTKVAVTIRGYYEL
jgi:hypothetical protein